MHALYGHGWTLHFGSKWSPMGYLSTILRTTFITVSDACNGERNGRGWLQYNLQQCKLAKSIELILPRYWHLYSDANDPTNILLFRSHDNHNRPFFKEGCWRKQLWIYILAMLQVRFISIWAFVIYSLSGGDWSWSGVPLPLHIRVSDPAPTGDREQPSSQTSLRSRHITRCA